MIPLLSIITATYNSENTLDETIKSILSQDYINFEYIIVDGASTDNTINIIKKFEPKFKEKNIIFKWISEPDSGIYNAWNKGLKIASGNWISFIGSDDIYLEGSFKKYAINAQKNPNKDFIYSKVKLMKGNYFIKDILGQWNWKTFKKSMEFAHVGAIHNKHFFENYGTFDESYKITGDYEMLLRAKGRLKSLFMEEFTVKMQVGGISNNVVSRAFKEARKAKIKTGGVNLFYANFDYLYMYFKCFWGAALRNLKRK
jgi:glycosyltransferase involved in cell wall biosynthesis